MNYQRIIKISFLLILLLVNFATAVTVTCGSPTNPGDYLFPNRDSTPVRVFINTAGTSISASPNNFVLPVGQSQLVSLRAPTDTYARLFVTYTDTISGFSASLECPMFASSGTASTTTTVPQTTTTVLPGCSGYNNQASCVAAGCIWMIIGGTGYCTGSSSSTTTTVPQTTTTVPASTTTIQSTTTTIQSSCSGKSYSQCISTSECQWIGSTITGYCKSTGSTTTTSSLPTTTTVTQTTIASSGGGGGSSGGSSGGGSSGGSSTSSKSTGFYDFPSFVQVPADGTKTIQGNFYAAKDLSNVAFIIAGLDNNWFTISPSSVQKINKNQTINITIALNIPESAKQDTYIFKISTDTGTVYEKAITLVVTEKAEPEETSTTIEEIEPTQPTGFFVVASEFAKTYWFVIAVPVILTGAWFLMPLLKTRSKGTAYSVEHEDEYDHTHNYVQLKYKEPVIEQEVKPVKKDIRDDIKRRVIKEIRERALKNERKR